jgi:DNA polymerase-1
MSECFLILDCNYLCHRAKHVFGELSHAGSATGVIYGFLTDLITLQNRFGTSRFVFCWDWGPSKRRRLFPTYKEQRRTQQPKTEEEEAFELAFRKQVHKLQNEYLHTIGYRNIFWQDGYESDDIIAAVCQRLPSWDTGVIVTADKDLYQCITKNVHWYDPRTKKLLTYGLFRKQYRIKPSKWAVVKAIAGCNSDNVPGIVGVGEVKALLYLTGAMSPESKTYKSIRGGWKSIVLRNRTLVQLPLPGLKPIQLCEDVVTQRGYNTVCKALGIKNIRWKRIR